MIRPISIVLVDDHALVRDMLRQQLTQKPTWWSELREQCPGRGAMLCRHLPGCGVAGYRYAGTVGVRGRAINQSQCSGTRLIFSVRFSRSLYRSGSGLGSDGLSHQNEPPEVVIQTIRQVMTGTVYFSDEVLARIVINGMAPDWRMRRRAEPGY